MEQCLHPYFIVNEELKSTCDFIPEKYTVQGFVYEVLRVIDGKIIFLDDHLERFYETFRIKNTVFSLSKKQVLEALKILIESNKVDIGNIKILGSSRHNGAAFWFAAWFIPHAYPTRQMYQDGVDLHVFDYVRENPNAKITRTSYKSEVARLIEKYEVYELLLASEGKVTEGSRSNIFFIKEETIYTASGESVLMGITRKKIIELCKDLGLKLIENDIFIENLLDFEAAFITGTSPKVLPVRQIQKVASYKTNQTILNLISRSYDEAIEKYLESFKWNQI
jgi:branched-chain amino acid aminotransferase